MKEVIEPSDKRPEDYEMGSMKLEQKKKPALPTRAGGVYVPPWKMEKIANDLKTKDPNSKEHQRFMWENLRKSINGLINKVNVSNIQNIILELFQENLIRGRGLLTKAIFKAQMASPNFTHVYAALVAVLNTKLPEVVKLLISRYIIQFQKAYKRNNKIVCVAAVRMLAHLVNQQVIHEVLALEILALFLENPTEDSIEMATDFMTECGQVLGDITPQGSIAIFERFKGILHEGECNRRVQYTIESLFNTRKSRFKNHPGVIQELDLIEEEDRITHEVSLTDEFDADDKVNFFQVEENYSENNKQWELIQKEILGEEEERINKRIEQLDESEESSESEEEDHIEDITEQDLMNLRKTIYLVIASSVDFEEVVHKLMKLNIREGQEIELCNMVTECCTQERTYLRFFGNIGERLCLLNEVYCEKFQESFEKQYGTVHRLDTNKLRNSAKFYAHLMYTETIDWSVLRVVNLTEDETTAASRIYLKILFQELSENMGMELFKQRLQQENVQPHLKGVFPRDSAKNARFSINFFTSIGLGAITVELREWLKEAPKLLMEQKLKEYQELQNLSSGSDSDSDSSSSSSSSGSSKSNKSSSSGSSRKSRSRSKSSNSKKSGSSSSSSSRRSSVSSESD